MVSERVSFPSSSSQSAMSWSTFATMRRYSGSGGRPIFAAGVAVVRLGEDLRGGIIQTITRVMNCVQMSRSLRLFLSIHTRQSGKVRTRDAAVPAMVAFDVGRWCGLAPRRGGKHRQAGRCRSLSGSRKHKQLTRLSQTAAVPVAGFGTPPGRSYALTGCVELSALRLISRSMMRRMSSLKGRISSQ